MAGSQKEPSTVHPFTDPILAARLEAIKQLAERVYTTGSAPMECVTRELRDMRKGAIRVRSSGFDVPKTSNFGPRTLGRLAHSASLARLSFLLMLPIRTPRASFFLFRVMRSARSLPHILLVTAQEI